MNCKWLLNVNRIVVILAAALFLVSCGGPGPGAQVGGGQAAGQSQAGDKGASKAPLSVHFIDVGQADCILIESEGKFMLIDAGNNADAELVTGYLSDAGVKRLEYVIGTHPHEDHIGSLDTVIENFDVGKIFLPKVSHNTKTYEDVLNAIADKGLKVTVPRVGDSYDLGVSRFTILAPNADYQNDLNNWSIGIRLAFEDTAFVMAGDAEADAERDICENGQELKADVLKLGHHGSSTSSSEEFLQAVDPQYAVISCETGNDYGHPHKETLEKMERFGIQVFRTDEQGTVVAYSDGTTITWSCEPAIKNDGADNEKTQDYVVNTKTKKFHLPDCRSVESIKEENREDFTGSRSELIEKGLEPCGNCRP